MGLTPGPEEICHSGKFCLVSLTCLLAGFADPPPESPRVVIEHVEPGVQNPPRGDPGMFLDAEGQSGYAENERSTPSTSTMTHSEGQVSDPTAVMEEVSSSASSARDRAMPLGNVELGESLNRDGGSCQASKPKVASDCVTQGPRVLRHEGPTRDRDGTTIDEADGVAASRSVTDSCRLQVDLPGQQPSEPHTIINEANLSPSWENGERIDRSTSTGDAGKRHGLRSMLSAAFLESLDSNSRTLGRRKASGLGEEPGPRLRSSRQSQTSLNLRKTPPSRRHSSTSLLSVSSAYSTSAGRLVRRGSTAEAEKAVQAILKRVKKREEVAKKHEGDGDDDGDICVVESPSEDNNGAGEVDSGNSDSDCDVSCDKHIRTQREQLAQRKKDIDSALVWLKHELVSLPHYMLHLLTCVRPSSHVAARSSQYS